MKLYYPDRNRLSSFSLPDGSDVILHPGQTVEIPDEFAENDYVKRLQALGFLVPPPDTEPTAEPTAIALPSPISAKKSTREVNE